MSLDPQIRRYLDEAAAEPAVYELELAQARRQFLQAVRDRNSGVTGPPAGVTTQDRVVDGIATRIFRPPEAAVSTPVTVHAHGGGWVLGGLDSHATQAGALCEASGSIVVSVDYRRAPEHPFPAALDDVTAVTAWVVANADEVGGDPCRVGLAGDSAGANLVAGVAARSRAWSVRPVAQLLVYPALDPRMAHPSVAAFGQGYGLDTATMRWFWDSYLPDAAMHADPEAAPLHRTDLQDLPPAMVVTAEYDLLRDEGEAYADAMEAAGVQVNLRRIPGMNHGFFGMAGTVHAAAQAVGEVGAAWRLLLTGGEPVGAGKPPHGDESG